MITEEQAREAAANMQFLKDARPSHDLNILAKYAVEELSRRDAELAELAKPITAEWLKSNGFDDSGAWLSLKYHGGKVYVGKDKLYVYVNATPMHTITTRGQLLDLLNALRGGGA